MQVLTSRVDFAGFVAHVASAPSRVLMLDYDGTLAPFHVNPELAVPYPEAAAALVAIMRSGSTRVVVVSGRPADELPRLLALDERPEIWGSHGWERLLPDGRRVVTEPGGEARATLADAQAAMRAVAPPDSRLEQKLASIALHWRGMPEEEAGALREAARVCWAPFARAEKVELLPFDGGLELRAVGCNKQYAVKAVLAETDADTAVAYLGDDITDEDAFRAVKARGVGVLVRTDFRPTDADVWIRPPQELAEFMSHWSVQARRS